MQILQLSDKIATLCGICSTLGHDERDLQLKYGPRIVISFFIVLLNLHLLFSVNEVFYEFQKGDIGTGLFAVLQVAAALSAIGSYASAIFQKKNIRNIFNELQKIVDQYEKTPSIVFYLHANKVSEGSLRLVMISMQSIGIFSSLFLATAGAVFYYTRDGYIDPTKLYLPLKLRMPLVENTFSGYCFLLIFEISAAAIFMLTTLTIASIFLSLGLFFDAARQQFELMFRNMNDLVAVNATPGSKIQLKQSLIDAIKFHIQVKDIFKVAQKAMNGTVFCQLFFGALFISISNFELELVIKAMDINILMVLLSVSLSSGSVFLYCLVGSNITKIFFGFAHVPYESLWYKYPIDLQKDLQFIIADAQRPLIFRGFGLIDLNLEVFAKVMKTVVSYYLMFKNFIE